MAKAKTRTAEKDAIALLKEDHKKVRKLLGELGETSAKAPSRREELLQTIERELKIHSKIEEEIFYPAFREAAEDQDDKKLYYEAVEEHHVVDMVLGELKEAEPASETFAAKAKVLKDLLVHHAEEEETEMFPRARKLMSREELRELHERLAETKTAFTEGVLTKLVELLRPSS
jgi:hemerythrin-like domain-containing protein